MTLATMFTLSWAPRAPLTTPLSGSAQGKGDARTPAAAHPSAGGRRRGCYPSAFSATCARTKRRRANFLSFNHPLTPG